MTSFIRTPGTPLHTSLFLFGVRQVRLYLNSPTYPSLLHADEWKHYNAILSSVWEWLSVFALIPYIYFLASEDFILSCFLAFHQSARSFLLLSQFRPRDVLQGIFVFLAKLPLAKRVSGAPWVRKWINLPIRENLVITWSYTDRKRKAEIVSVSMLSKVISLD